MIVWETVVVAFSMFSALPMPRCDWNEKNMRYALCAFPLIGAVCGLLWWGWSALCGFLPLPLLLRAAGYCLIPVLLTGGIHLDGYADTCDALSSYGEPEEKQKILKDPHCGAFAVIRLCTYFVAYFALCAALEVTAETLWCMGSVFVLERALSGYAINAFPLAKDTGLAYTYASAANKKRARLILLAIAALSVFGMVFFGRLSGVAMLIAALAVFWRYYRVAKKQFGGISGDLAGWFLQKAELWMLAALVACQVIGGAL